MNTLALSPRGLLARHTPLSHRSSFSPRSALAFVRPLPECAFLVEAAARRSAAPDRTDRLVATLAALERQDRAARARPGPGRFGPVAEA